jgi:hypothetical protein
VASIFPLGFSFIFICVIPFKHANGYANLTPHPHFLFIFRIMFDGWHKLICSFLLDQHTQSFADAYGAILGLEAKEVNTSS